MLPRNPYWAWLMHPAVNTDTHSVPRPGTISQALIHPCLLIPLPANPPACWSDKELNQVTLSQWSGGGGSATGWAHLMMVNSAVCSPHQGRQHQVVFTSLKWQKSISCLFLASITKGTKREKNGERNRKGTRDKSRQKNQLFSLKN